MPGRFDSVERRFFGERSVINLMEWIFNGKLMIFENFRAVLSDMISKLYNTKWMRGVSQLGTRSTYRTIRDVIDTPTPQFFLQYLNKGESEMRLDTFRNKKKRYEIRF